MAHRVAVVRATAAPPRDPDGRHRLRLRELAVAAGVDPGELIDEWHSRVDALLCCDTPDAEQIALAHIEERLCVAPSCP